MKEIENCREEMSRKQYELNSTKEEKEPKTLAVWGPKPGDGASTVAKAAAELLWERRTEDTEKIVLLEYNTRTPYLKYQLGLDGRNLLDDMLPFISASKLTPDILGKYMVTIYNKEGLQFIGGIKRPELNGRYNHIHFNFLLDAVESISQKTVIDAGNIPDQAGTVTALKKADYILAVLQPSYVSKQCFKHCLSLFPALGINPDKVGIVYNRYSSQDEDPQVMAAGLNTAVLGTLNELGSEKNLTGHSWLLDDKGTKTVTAYRENLKNILEACRMLPPGESKKKGGLLPRFFVKGAIK